VGRKLGKTSGVVVFCSYVFKFIESINKTARLSHDLSRFFFGKVGNAKHSLRPLEKR
jgi:hypothetical protein